MSQCPKIMLYICTKQINFFRNSSEGHFQQSNSPRVHALSILHYADLLALIQFVCYRRETGKLLK